MNKIHRYVAKEGITEEYLKAIGFRYGKVMGFDSAFMGFAVSVEIKLPDFTNKNNDIKIPFVISIAFGSDLSEWNDDDNVCVLEAYTGAVYGPFYAALYGEKLKTVPPCLPVLIDAYNEFMDRVPFLERYDDKM